MFAVECINGTSRRRAALIASWLGVVFLAGCGRDPLPSGLAYGSEWPSDIYATSTHNGLVPPAGSSLDEGVVWYKVDGMTVYGETRIHGQAGAGPSRYFILDAQTHRVDMFVDAQSWEEALARLGLVAGK